MRQGAHRTMVGVSGTLKLWRGSIPAAAAKWRGVSTQERVRLRNHVLAVIGAATTAVLSLASGHAAGPLIAVDLAIAAAAWFAGVSAGLAAALAALLVIRVASPPLLATPFADPLVLVVFGKWALVAIVSAAVSRRAREDGHRIAGLEARIQQVKADARQAEHQLRQMEATFSSTQAQLRYEADLARQQLTTLQSVTDPSLNVLSGVELVSSLLDRLRAALDADGVAIYHHQGLRGRVFSATGGMAPLGNARRARPAGAYQMGRAALIHNDAERVAETSLCRWPPEVASLILVPVVHGDRLQLVVEVVNLRGRRSTEWELALIQVVAERAAGLLRPDASFDTGAVA